MNRQGESTMVDVTGYQEAIQKPILFELTYRTVGLRNDFSIEKPIDEFHGRLERYFPEAAKQLKAIRESDGRTRLYTWIQFGLKKQSQDSPRLIDWKKYESYGVTDEGASAARTALLAACDSANQTTIEKPGGGWRDFLSFLRSFYGVTLPAPLEQATFPAALAQLTRNQFREFLKYKEMMGSSRSPCAAFTASI
jgi:hypothetical protein